MLLSEIPWKASFSFFDVVAIDLKKKSSRQSMTEARLKIIFPFFRLVEVE